MIVIQPPKRRTITVSLIDGTEKLYTLNFPYVIFKVGRHVLYVVFSTKPIENSEDSTVVMATLGNNMGSEFCLNGVKCYDNLIDCFWNCSFEYKWLFDIKNVPSIIQAEGIDIQAEGNCCFIDYEKWSKLSMDEVLDMFNDKNVRSFPAQNFTSIIL